MSDMPRREVLQMPYKHNGNSYDLPIQIATYVPSKGYGDKKPVVVGAALFEERLVARKVGQHLQQQGRAAIVAVYRFGNRDAIDYTCREGLRFLGEHVNQVFGDDPDSSISTFSHSMFGGITPIAANYTPQLVGGRHVLDAPAGVNTHRMGNTVDERIDSLWGRLKENTKQPGMMGTDHWRYCLDTAWRVAAATGGSLLTNHYMMLPAQTSYALGDYVHDQVMSGLNILAKQADTAIIYGADDGVFPRHELEPIIAAHGLRDYITAIEGPGSHESLASPKGLAHIDLGFDFIDRP